MPLGVHRPPAALNPPGYDRIEGIVSREGEAGFAPKRERPTAFNVKGWSNAITRHFAKPSRECSSRRSRRTLDQFLRRVPPPRNLHCHSPPLGEERETESQADTWGSVSLPAVGPERFASVILVLPNRGFPPKLRADAIGYQRTPFNESEAQNCQRIASGPSEISF
jgi:hypothetical protein